jgi:hypothetical protein
MMGGYALYFIGCGLIGVPALLLCLLLIWKTPVDASTRGKAQLP